MPPIDEPRGGAAPPRPWWIGLAVLAMGLVWIYGATSIQSTTAFVGMGPEVMVAAVGVGLVVLGVLLLVQIRQGVTFRPQEEENADADAPPSRRAFLLSLAGVALPLATIRWLGFPLTAAVGFTLVTHAFGSHRTLFDLAVGAALGGGAWFMFSKLGIDLGPFLPLIR
ncbi:putative tricarboxylic transport membrane protein [Angulomicrobium tetraedrale]|uniref:Putative tricarboxylic transport membrane protein n=1 Tax=Ancylobacter tetraedralis TaxID=217068 RepID=A0A839Z660_9HYPH|nr:tripartite tricarboxylate transporter TctB family protein [Ancylobacter tetraedralis]MBB3769455.1 putative tricarboxylic transport membrane protein [Ancylobacter tetraedralis]